MTTNISRVTIKAPWVTDVVLTRTDGSDEYGTDQRWFYAVVDDDDLPVEGMTGYTRTKAEAVMCARQDMRRTLGW